MNESAADDVDESKMVEEAVSARNGLYCFLGGDRECGADCMAYTTEPNESKTLGPQQKNCLLLISMERLGRYVGGLASAANKIQQRSATEAADRIRASSAPPLDPRGNKS